MMRRFLTVLAIPFGLCAASGLAQAQEIQLTGPLAGAPAVRQLRLHRQGRLEISPQVSFTILDEYQRHILIGFQANYNFTDWFALGIWWAPGKVVVPLGLTEHIQEVTQARRNGPGPEQGGIREPNEPDNPDVGISTNNRLTASSIGSDFKKQLGTINSVIAPQISLVPFRGKLAIFQKIFVDADAYVFGGPAIVSLTERKDCDTNCTDFTTQSRVAVTGTFGLGLKFYTNRYTSLGLEWRALPFAWNTGGFDMHGGGPDAKFPDRKINDADREFKFNQILSVSLGFYLPTSMKRSE